MKPKYNLSQAKEIPGRDKPYWVKVCIGLEKEGKIRIILDVLPIPNKDGEIWLNLFENDKDDAPDGFMGG